MTKQAYSYLLFGQLLNELPKGVFTHNEIGLISHDALGPGEGMSIHGTV